MSANTSLQVGGFALPTPADWQIASIILVGPPDAAPDQSAQQFQQNIVVVSEPVGEDETPQSYVQKQTGKLKEQKALYAAPGKLEEVSLPNARKGVIFEHVVLGPGQERVRQMQVVSIHQGRMHALIASHLDGPRFAAQRDGLKKILTGAQLP